MGSRSSAAAPIVASLDVSSDAVGVASRHAVQVAADLARERGAVLHVVAGCRDERGMVLRRAEQALGEFLVVDLEVRVHAPDPCSDRAIRDVAQDVGADRIITVGAPARRGALARLTGGRPFHIPAVHETLVDGPRGPRRTPRSAAARSIPANTPPATPPAAAPTTPPAAVPTTPPAAAPATPPAAAPPNPPATPPAAANSEPAHEDGHGFDRRVLLISIVAVFMAFLDATIVNVAFPAIHHSFRDVSLSNLSWVLNAYNVVVAAALVPAGRLIDRIGRRKGFLAGLGLFLVGSGICGFAPDASALIAARVVQALGAAMLIPASFGVLLAACPLERRARATSAWAAAGAVAAAAGPSLGGVLVQAVGWRWIFFVNIVLAVGLIRAPKILSESREASQPLPDLLGTGLLAVAVGSLALGIVKAPDWGWTAPATLLCWCVALALAALLVRRSAGHPSPVIEPALMRVPSFARSNAGFLIFSAAFYALLLGNILFLTDVWHYSVLRAGFAVTPGPLVAAVAAAVGGRICERSAPRVVAIPGMVGFALACFLYRHVGDTPAYLSHWLPAQIPSGASIGLAIAALSSASVRDLPPDRVATGTALTACFRQIGAVIGIAGLIAIVSAITPETAMSAFRLAWLLMASASVLAIIPAAGLGSLRTESAAARRRVALGTLRRRLGETAPSPALPVLLPPAPERRTRTIPGFAQRDVVLHGSRVAFSIAGDGPPVVLLHGLLDDSLTWRRVAPLLARRYTVIVPDLAGHGRSGPASHGDYAPGGHALLLRELLDALGWDRVALVGHSLGGAIALTFAAQNPDRLARIALISPGGFGREVHRLLRLAASPGGGPALRLISSAPVRWCLDRAAWVLARVGLAKAGLGASGLSEFLAGLAPAEARHAFLRTNAAVIDRRGQTASAIPWVDAWRRVPTLVLWGSADRVIPVEHSFALADAHPEAEVVLLDGVGHLAHRERPAVVAERLTRFLDQGRQVRPGEDAGSGLTEPHRPRRALRVVPG